MENNQNTPSVIAKLMGIDDAPIRQQPIYRQQRVLSDNYLQKSCSIGKRSRTYSQNNLLESKKKVNRRASNLSKDTLFIDFEKNNREIGQKNIDVLKPNVANAQQLSRPYFLLDHQTSFAWEVKKQLLEKLKLTKFSQELRSDFASSIGVKSKEGWKHESATKLPIFKRLNLSSSSTIKSVKTTTSDMSITTKKNKLVPNSSNPLFVNSKTDSRTEDLESFYSAKEGSSCHSSDLSSEQDPSIRSFKDCSISSNSIQTDEENTDSKVEAYQHSPNSVLDPSFMEDNLSTSEYYETGETDLHDLWMQLQLLKSEENDTSPEMITSSDDERSSCNGQQIKSTPTFGFKESRDFSYMVDVLDESWFENGNVDIMVGPSVFETLEKKYGKQDLWHKSERRLLFDRINIGITEILRPQLGIYVSYKPLRRKMLNMFRRNVMEEELSMLLFNQEKGFNDGVSEKAVGRGPWFEPLDELDSIVKEIEMFLFDELALELAYV